jgi:hypothetical protein
MNQKSCLLLFIAFMIITDSLVGIETSTKTGTAIVAVNDFNSPGTSFNVGHVAVLFENPEDHSYKFVSVQADGQNEPIKPEEFSGLTKEDAEKKLLERGYTRFKTYEVKDPKFENADAEVDNLKKERFEIFASTPGGLISHTILAVSSFSLPDLAYDNCLTGGIKILEKYGAEMPQIEPLKPTTPKDYYERLTSEEEEYTWSNTENKYISTATGTFSKTSSEGGDLGGINFTSIKLNYIALSHSQDGGVNLDLVLNAQKANGTSPGIDIINSTSLGAIAFLTGLAVPDYKFEVNLHPKEPDRIIDEQLAQSDVGRIMLEADFQMKKDFAKYSNPCENQTGKALLDLLDKKQDLLIQRCMNKYPGEINDIHNIQFRPVTRHNIVPDKVYAYTNETQICIINSSLKINSKADTDDSIFRLSNQDINSLSTGCVRELNESAKEFAEYYTELTDLMIQTYVIADVNHAEKYEDLRNVYVALALAQWYNHESRITINKNAFREGWDSINSIVLKSMSSWSPREIWNRYVYSYENGEYTCWKNETTNTPTGKRYMSRASSRGGVTLGNMRANRTDINKIPSEIQYRLNKAVAEGFIDEGNEVLFGNRIHIGQRKENSIPSSGSGSPSESTIINLVGLSNENASRQDKEIPLAAVVANDTLVTCPEGWMGPDENGECWQLQITDVD